MRMKENLLRAVLISFILLFTFSVSAQPAASTQPGQDLFKANCMACHSIGKGKMVGPDLKNVHQKRSEAWLLKWIRSSKTLINSGDADAVAIFGEFNKTPMTEFSALTDDQIKSLIRYIGSESSASPAAASASAPSGTNVITPSVQTGIPALLLILGILILVLLAVIIYLSGVILKLSGEVADQFDNERSFLKKY